MQKNLGMTIYRMTCGFAGRLSVLCLVVIGLGACSDNENPSVEIATENTHEINAEHITRHIARLASDEFEGRAPATPGGLKTREYIASEMARLGMQTVAGDSYFHKVPLVEMTVTDESWFSIGPGVSANGRQTRMTKGDEIVFWSNRVAEKISFEDSDLIFIGYGVVAPEYDWNDYEGVDVTGKTVVMLVNDPGFATQDANLFNGNSMTS